MLCCGALKREHTHTRAQRAFGAVAKVKAPHWCGALARVLGTLELLGHYTKRIFNELPLLVCLKKEMPNMATNAPHAAV